MPPISAPRPSQVIGGAHMTSELDCPTSHLESLLGDPFADDDTESLRSSHHPDPDPDPDPDMVSICSLRSHPSHLDSILTRPLITNQTTRPSPPGPNKLHRRRNQYSYIDNAVPLMAEPSSLHDRHRHHHHSPRQHPPPQQQQSFLQPDPEITRSRSAKARQSSADHLQGQQSHRRAKSYTLSGRPSSWLMSSPLVDVRRSGPWAGERREIRKLQKEHPVGSARPSMSLEIGDGDGTPADCGDRGSGLGVRKKMGRLRELYRK